MDLYQDLDIEEWGDKRALADYVTIRTASALVIHALVNYGGSLAGWVASFIADLASKTSDARRFLLEVRGAIDGYLEDLDADEPLTPA